MTSEKRLRDLVASVPGERLGELLKGRGGFLRHLAKEEMEEVARTELRVALQGLVDRVGIELERLALAPFDAEQAARAVRNCLETNLIGRYVMASHENTRNWFALRAQEEIDILSSLVRVYSDSGNADQVTIVKGRISELNALLLKHAMPKAIRL